MTQFVLTKFIVNVKE